MNFIKKLKDSYYRYISKLALQQMPVWRPKRYKRRILLIIDLITIPIIVIGIIVLYIDKHNVDIKIEYTNCHLFVDKYEEVDGYKLSYDPTLKICTIKGYIPEMKNPSISYLLKGFIQNYSDYTNSKSIKQLKGEPLKYSELSECGDFAGPPEYESLKDDRPVYYPCGLFADSMYRDKIISFINEDNIDLVKNIKDNEVWKGFHSLYKNTGYKNNDPKIFPPPSWKDIDTKEDGSWKDIPKLDNDFIIWITIAGFPNFKKTNKHFDIDLTSGHYIIKIYDVFDFKPFRTSNSAKYLIFESSGRFRFGYYFNGIIYILVGTFIFIMTTIILIFSHLFRQQRKKLRYKILKDLYK